MENRPFVSVVMPVYNVEKHLEKAVNSVLKQTLQDFEIILVDDCSPDKCPQICEHLSKIHSQIKVLHHEANKGLSEARNTGLKVAEGKYIWFMDSDDYVDADLFERVHESVKKNPAKVVVFGLTEDYYTAQDTLHHSQKIVEVQRYFDKAQELREYVITLEQKTLYGYAWNKFYDLDYLRTLELKYEKVTLIEDILFNVKYFMDIDSMNILNFCGYHYNKRMDNSLTSKFVADYYKLHHKRIEMIYQQYQYWNMCTEEIKEILGALYVRYIFSAIQRNCDSRAQMNYSKRRRWIQRLYQEKLFLELIPHAKTDAGLLKIMAAVLQKRMTFITQTIGRVIYVCKTKLPMVFSAVKQKR